MAYVLKSSSCKTRSAPTDRARLTPTTASSRAAGTPVPGRLTVRSSRVSTCPAGRSRVVQTLCRATAATSRSTSSRRLTAGPSVHLASEEERKKIPEISDLLVDLGLPKEKVQDLVKVGDMVTLQAPFTTVGDTVVSQCLDNRVACWLALKVLGRLVKKEMDHAAELHIVFTVQEEVGLRGAITSSYTVRPDIGIGLDTTLCVDTPGVPDDQRCTRQGHGVALTVMDSASIGDIGLLEDFERIAEQHAIKAQRSLLARGGTDTAGIQKAASGTRAFTLSVPTRYIHTVCEMIHLDDLHAARDLLTAFLADVK